MFVLGIILLNLSALHCNAAPNASDGPEIIDVDSFMSPFLQRILSAFEAAPLEPFPRISDQTAFEEQLLREMMGLKPVEAPELHEIFFPIHIIHFIEIPEEALEGESEQTCVNIGFESSSSVESQALDDNTSSNESSDPSELEGEVEDFANKTESGLVGDSEPKNEVITKVPEWPGIAANNSTENEISSEADESVVPNKQAEWNSGSSETYLSEPIDFIPVETAGSGKLLEALLKGTSNDAPSTESTKKPEIEIPEARLTVGFFDRLKYILGL